MAPHIPKASRLIVSAVLFVFLAASSFATKANHPALNWMSFDTGMQQATQEGKYVLLYFQADWCSYCTMMEQTTYKDSEVLRELRDHFISIKVDTESEASVTWEDQSFTEKEFSAYMEVGGLPTLLFLSPESEVIGHYPSFADKNLMFQLLQYISSGARESGSSFGEFLESSN
jgi:thioredoxin-related protein